LLIGRLYMIGLAMSRGRSDLRHCHQAYMEPF